jgi:hypothetical protein
MGAVFGSGDITKGRKRVVENALRDIHPDVKDQIIDLLTSWEGAISEEKLKAVMGKEKAKTLLEEISRLEDK